MDSLKEIIDAFEARVRSKVVGSVILAFVAMNWKVIFYVVFAGETPETKFKYFDEHTNIWTLFTYPVCIGIGFAMLLPWVNAGAMYLTLEADKKQTDLKNDMKSFNSMSKDLNELKYEAEREEAIAKRNAALVKSAKVDEAAKTIQDPKVREKVQKELSETKSELSEKKSFDFKDKGLDDQNNHPIIHPDNFNDYPLEELEEKIKLLDGYLGVLQTQIEFSQTARRDLYNSNEDNTNMYYTLLNDAQTQNDEKAIVALKLKRAREIEDYQFQVFEVEHELEKNIRESLVFKSEKEALVSELESRYSI